MRLWKKLLIGTAIVFGMALGAAYLYREKYPIWMYPQLKKKFKAYSDSAFQIEIGENLVKAHNITPNLLPFLRIPARHPRFLQFVNPGSEQPDAPISAQHIHPHYFFYKRTLLTNNLPLTLNFVDVRNVEEENKILTQKYLGFTPEQYAKEGVHYLLINPHGDVICHSPSSMFDPASYGVSFLKGPKVMKSFSDFLEAVQFADPFEHTYFIVYNGTDQHYKKGVLLNSFRKVFAELSYPLQNQCTFLEISNSELAMNMGIDTREPGRIYCFHTVNKFNTKGFPEEEIQNFQGVRLVKSYDQKHKFTTLEKEFSAKYEDLNREYFDPIFNSVWTFVMNSLFYDLKVQYCPNADYLKHCHSIYKGHEKEVLYIAVDPYKITRKEFRRLYKELLELSSLFPAIRIVFTDFPKAPNVVHILLNNKEKYTIRYINYKRCYTAEDHTMRLVRSARHLRGTQFFVEKYKLDIGESEPRQQRLAEFIKKCKEREVEPHRECEDIGEETESNLIQLNATNWNKTLFETHKEKKRIVLVYCKDCVKCQQVMNSLNSFVKESDQNVELFTYYIGNESKLNAFAKDAPMMLFFDKDEKAPPKIAFLKSIVIGPNSEAEVHKKIADFLNVKKGNE